MAKYKKKPVEVEAFKFYVDGMPDWFTDLMSTNEAVTHNCDYRRWGIDEAYCIIDIPFREKICVFGGEYIVKDENGEISTFKPDIFRATYELVNEGHKNDYPQNMLG